jgi:GDP-mannose 4,6 dehydratase
MCARLLEQECQVLCVDNYFTGTRRNIEPLFGEPAFEVMRHDVTFPLYVEVDEIYNLAGPASPIHYQHDPVQTTKTSVIGAINMLGLAKRLHARILQASTSEVYGDPDVHPQTEEYRGHVKLAGPRGCYDEGKRCAEALFYDYKRQHRLSIRVARIFNTYGPNMHPQDGRVVSSFIIQALNNQPITIYGSGANEIVLLCRRSGRWPHAFDECRGRRRRAGQSRQSLRNNHFGTGRAYHLPRWLAFEARVPSAATGRHPTALPRHHPRQADPALAASGAAQGRPEPNHPLFR